MVGSNTKKKSWGCCSSLYARVQYNKVKRLWSKIHDIIFTDSVRLQERKRGKFGVREWMREREREEDSRMACTFSLHIVINFFLYIHFFCLVVFFIIFFHSLSFSFTEHQKTLSRCRSHLSYIHKGWW